MPSILDRLLKRQKDQALAESPGDLDLAASSETEWNQVIERAKELQKAVASYAGSVKQGTGTKAQSDVQSILGQLNAVVGAVVTMTESFSQEVQPLIGNLIKESSEAKAVEITKDITTAQTKILKTMADTVNNAPTDKDKQIEDDADKIGTGFGDILKGKNDPRIGFGKIPTQKPTSSSGDGGISGGGGVTGGNSDTDKDKQIAEDAQKIKEGFEDILKGKDDPRMGFGRIPKRTEVAVPQEPPPKDVA